jgi:hypothetical protein
MTPDPMTAACLIFLVIIASQGMVYQIGCDGDMNECSFINSLLICMSRGKGSMAKKGDFLVDIH